MHSGCEQLQRFTPLDWGDAEQWVQAEHNAFFMCDKFEKPLFFPRVRTPCGHGAQVIVEGREEQSDGGEKNKEIQHNPKQTTQSPQAESPPSCSLSSVLGETGKTKTSV